MPLQNRVAPDGTLITTSARGTFLGNRGRLHDEHKRIIRNSNYIMWLICRLEFNGRKREIMAPNQYTELFFLDEAVGLAAGHRPCYECRRPYYRAYLDAVSVGRDEPITKATVLNKVLHASRNAPRVAAPISSLPDGVFVHSDNGFHLLWRDALHRWTAHGYVAARPAADVGEAEVVTPALSVAALRNGYPVTVHESAG